MDKRTIGSHPGAITFRFSSMVILISAFVLYFFFYFDDSQKEIERASISQTKRIVDSSLTVIFASYAVKGKLDKLNDLNGGNPFTYMAEFQILPPSYRGVIEDNTGAELNPGWYYLSSQKQVVYVPRYLTENRYFSLYLDFDDVNGSGVFESQLDQFKNLKFIQISDH